MTLKGLFKMSLFNLNQPDNLKAILHNPKYSGKDNYGKLREIYVHRLFAMTDSQLEEECEKVIWLSAYANNNPKSDYHWQADACYDVARSRDKISQIYEKAYNNASKRK